MRRSIGLVLTTAGVLLILVAFSAARYFTFDRPTESEASPNRSTYNSGPTGTKAFYQVLERSGRPVGRWRESFRQLEQEGRHSTLIMIGPFEPATLRDPQEIRALERWVSNGGKLLLVTRHLQFGFRGSRLRMTLPAATGSEAEIDPKSDRYILQPTRVTRRLRGLAISRQASRLRLDQSPIDPASAAHIDDLAPLSAPEDLTGDLVGPLSAPITHLGDEDGAILIDFNFGGGRVLLLTDPFVMANNGIGQGENLDLMLNLVGEIYEPADGSGGLVLFDEYHHGYRNDSNPLFTLLRGTPWPLILLQAALLVFLLCHHLSRRFTRPLPRPVIDRLSPLEFVDSMASLQQAAQARDLAVDNIYPRFRARLCRYLGLSPQAGNDEILARQVKFKPELAEFQLGQTLAECEMVLRGQPVTDQQLLLIISRLRAAEAALPVGNPRR